MAAKLSKVGNSISVRIPKAILDELVLGAGDSVDIIVAKEQIVLKPIHSMRKKKPVTLQQLLRDLKPEHLHPEVDWGPPVGSEFR